MRLLDIYLQNATENLIDPLNRALPDGFEVVKSTVVALQLPSVFAATTGFQYLVQINECIDCELLRRIEEFLTAREIEFQRETSKSQQKINLRSFVETIRCKEPNLQIVTKVINGRTVKIKEILQTLNIDGTNCRIVRQKTYLTPVE